MALYYVAAEIPRSRRRLRKDAFGSPLIYVTPNRRIAERAARSIGMGVYRIAFVPVEPRRKPRKPVNGRMK